MRRSAHEPGADVFYDAEEYDESMPGNAAPDAQTLRATVSEW